MIPIPVLVKLVTVVVAKVAVKKILSDKKDK